MSSLTVGILYASQRFIELVAQDKITSEDFKASFGRYYVADAKVVLELTQQYGWVRINEDGTLKLTNTGSLLLAEPIKQKQLQLQLEYIIPSIGASWTKRLSNGRTEATKTMPNQIKQIFEEAGLLVDSLTDEIVEWWRRIGLIIRTNRSNQNSLLGLEAEKLTLDYEFKRTSHLPFWQAIESSFAGYDVLSIKGNEDPAPLRIEVKGSGLHKNEAFFYLTRNEWDVAITSGSYCFHLWLMNPSPQLASVSFENIKDHVAQDQGDGRWDNIKIPFAPFFSSTESLIPL